jgi:hypothetical protein
MIRERVNWNDLAQDTKTWRTLVRVVIQLRIPYNSENLTNCGTVNFSRRSLLLKGH